MHQCGRTRAAPDAVPVVGAPGDPTLQTFEAELNPLQQQTLNLLGVPTTSYKAAQQNS